MSIDLSRFTERQRLAYLSPCARAHDTLRPEFARRVVLHARRGAPPVELSTILTVNK